jgi:gas vesicle protein
MLWTVFGWLHAHPEWLGITAVITSVGGVVMWLLTYRNLRLNNRKLKLEIDHLKIDTKRIGLEVQRLTEEKTRQDAAGKLADLSERIVELAKKYTRDNPTWGSSAPLSEEQLCSELNESQEAIAKALQALKSQGRTSYRGQTQTWVVKV